MQPWQVYRFYWKAQGACDNQPAKTPFRFQIAKAARTQARTWVQSCSLGWPITVNSER
jgi:hypothetical protein